MIKLESNICHVTDNFLFHVHGKLFQTQEKFQKAWNHFTIAIEVDPKSYLAYEGRAVVCLQMGNYFAALQDINTAIKVLIHLDSIIIDINQYYR